MDRTEFENKFWSFYINLEEEFLEIEKIIPYDKINKNTFSYKFMGLLLSICAEIDFTFKMFIESKDDSFSRRNFDDYERFVENYYHDFKNSEVKGYKNRFRDLRCKPFKYWRCGDAPKWWQVYNKIKHNRIKIKEDENEWYLYANQKNVLKALGALFILNMYFYRECVDDLEKECVVPLPQSRIFNLENWGDYRSNLIGNNYYLDSDTLVLHYNERP